MEGRQFPTWIIRYWSEVEISHRAKGLFTRALKVLEAHQARNDVADHYHGVVDQALQILSRIPSSGSLQGFPVAIEMCYIAQFVGTDWLTDEHINILMEML